MLLHHIFCISFTQSPDGGYLGCFLLLFTIAIVVIFVTVLLQPRLQGHSYMYISSCICEYTSRINSQKWDYGVQEQIQLACALLPTAFQKYCIDIHSYRQERSICFPIRQLSEYYKMFVLFSKCNFHNSKNVFLFKSVH